MLYATYGSKFKALGFIAGFFGRNESIGRLSEIDTPDDLTGNAAIVIRGLDSVMGEIDGLNRATLDSITLKTLLRYGVENLERES